MTSIHNIRRPAFWLLLTTVAAAVFFVLTDPELGWVSYATMGPLDAWLVGRWGTWTGLLGSAGLFVVALFLCTRKGTPPTAQTGDTGR